MMKALLLLAALLVAGCGEKSSSEGSEAASENPTPSNESAEPSGDTPKSLSDADVEQLLKEAVDMESLEERDDLYYQPNESEPFSGWAKTMSDSGQVAVLGRLKDGKLDGLWTDWHENGQKMVEMIYKDGEVDGLFTMWHENGQKEEERTFKDGKPADGLHTQWHADGQKQREVIYKDGKRVSAKYWNSKGEEVETPEAAEE